MLAPWCLFENPPDQGTGPAIDSDFESVVPAACSYAADWRSFLTSRGHGCPRSCSGCFGYARQMERVHQADVVNRLGAAASAGFLNVAKELAPLDHLGHQRRNHAFPG